MKRHPFVLSPLPVAILIASLAFPPQSAWALRAESTRQAGGLEELAAQLTAPFRSPVESAGLEEGWGLEKYLQEFSVGTVVRAIPAGIQKDGKGVFVIVRARDRRRFSGFIPNSQASDYENWLHQLPLGRPVEARVIESEIVGKRLHLRFALWNDVMKRRVMLVEGLQEGQDVEVTVQWADGSGLHGFYKEVVPVFIPMSTVSYVFGRERKPEFEEWPGIRVLAKVQKIDLSPWRFSAALDEILEDSEAGGLEEPPAAQGYREAAERVRAAMQRLGVQTTLTPGEVWMLGRLADPAGHLGVGGLDQKFEGWLPAIGHPDSQNEWDVRYRMTIAARLSRELAADQQKTPWRQGRPLYTGRIGFVFSRNVITNSYFSQLRNGSIPIEMENHLSPGQTLKDVPFLAQGDNSAVPRWKPAETEMTVQEAMAAGAVGYKTSVMLPVQLDQSAYSPYWTRLTDQNLAWVQQRAKEARSAANGLGVGYLAGAILWAAPPSDFVPPADSLAAIGQSPERFQEEMGKEQPAEWALDVLMKAWLDSDRKKEIEQSELFSSAHAALTQNVVERWNRTPGITLIQAAGPYFISAQGELTQRVVPAREAIGRLAKLPGLKGKIVPATRNRPPAVFHEEFTWMADAGLAGAVTVGRSLLQSLIDGQTGKFRMMHTHVFRQGIARAAVDLLIGIDRLREKQAPGIWSAHGVTPVQAEQLIRSSRSAGGLEEGEGLAPSQVEERLREAMDGYEQVTVMLSGFPLSLLEKHSLGFTLSTLGPDAILYRLQPLLQELGSSARLVLEVDGGGAFTLAARFLPIQRSYPGNRFPRAVGSRLRRVAIAVLQEGAAFSPAFQEFLGPGSERKFLERENTASPIDLQETEVRALLGMAETGEPTDRQKMLLAISPALLNVVALAVEETDKDKDRREVSPVPLNTQQVMEMLERHPELRVETQIKVGPEREPLTLDYRQIRQDERLKAMIGSFMDTALRLAGLSQTGLEEVKKLSLEQFREQFQPVLDEQPAVRERLIHFTEKGADTARVIQLNRPLTAHVHGKTLLQDVERQRWPERLLRFVPWTLPGVEAEQWGFILRNEDVPGELPLNPKGLFVKPVSPGHLPSADQLVAEFYWNEFKIPMPELLLGQMIFSDGQQTYLVLFSA